MRRWVAASLLAWAGTSCTERNYGQNYTEPAAGANIEMVWIPGGRYQMGSPASEQGRSDFEGPVHQVTLDGFWMGKYEVT